MQYGRQTIIPTLLSRGAVSRRGRSRLAAGLIVLLAAIGAGGCDTQERQDSFVDEAGRPPSGITRTSETGEILTEDPDDWRTAPAYQGQVIIDTPAYPNPTVGGFVSIDLKILPGPRLGGNLVLRVPDAQGRLQQLARVPNQTGLYTLTFPTASLPSRGLHRLFLFDARAELVSYGDVELR